MSHIEGVVRELVENIVFEEKLENYTINIKPISTDGANYTSILYKVTVTSKGREDINHFTKVALMSESIRKLELEKHISFLITADKYIPTINYIKYNNNTHAGLTKSTTREVITIFKNKQRMLPLN